MKAVFVDTAGWMACADASFRRGCAEARADQGQRRVHDIIGRQLGWGQIDSSQRLRWERIDEVRCLRAREFFFRHHDKNSSFTDCTSFVVMRELGLTRALM